VLIPSGERIGFDATADAERFAVSESGITVVPKDYRFQIQYS
jgi:glucose-1-phosphate adenylyltransferase